MSKKVTIIAMFLSLEQTHFTLRSKYNTQNRDKTLFHTQQAAHKFLTNSHTKRSLGICLVSTKR